MEKNATDEQINAVIKAIESKGLRAEKLTGPDRTAIGVMGNKSFVDEYRILSYDGVKEIIHVTKPYKLVSREYKSEDTVFEVKGAKFGGGKPVIIAGPCSVESMEQFRTIAKAIKELGADMLRGGAFKPRTSPYSFQGLGEEGLKIMKQVSEEVGLPFITEIVDAEDLDLFVDYDVDMFQIGARNMQNYNLLKKVAKVGKPILLKRGMSATFEEFMLAAEYILNEGNKQVALCERGIRTFENSSRNTLDLNTLALVKLRSHLPIIVDPSHAAGHHELVTPLALAGLAAGGDGLIVEVHNNPAEALSDGAQSLTISKFENLMSKL